MSWAERPLGYAGPIRLDPRDLHRIAVALERIAAVLEEADPLRLRFSEPKDRT